MILQVREDVLGSNPAVEQHELLLELREFLDESLPVICSERAVGERDPLNRQLGDWCFSSIPSDCRWQDSI